MSVLRIFIGLLIAGLFLAGELIAFWYFGLPAKSVPILLLAFVALGGGLIVEIQVRKALRPYWQRACTGIRWRRRFPDVPKTEIREFLILFVDAFAFRRNRRCCFSPDDRVMDVYRALYPFAGMADCMELETFCEMVQKRYGLDFATSWREDLTLGQIYEQTRRRAA
jgi:hypothetical protein